MRTKLRLQDLVVDRQRVLVRVDFNVPVADGRVIDFTRIDATLPTIRHLLRAGAAVVLMAHRGRPRGERRPDLSLQPVADALADRLAIGVRTVCDCVGAAAQNAVAELDPGQVLLLENLRFHGGETSNDQLFAEQLAGLADAYVNDAFGVSHREHASVVGVAQAMARAAAGDLLQREVSMLSRVLIQPAPPFVLVLGGAKVEDKVAIIANLLPLVDRIVIGGAMANAFLAAAGRQIGNSLAPPGAIEQAGNIMAKAAQADVDLVLPSDLVVAPEIDAGERAQVVRDVGSDQMALDIGPRSTERFAGVIGGARTVVWNGPMGVFERPAFAAGTQGVAEAIGALGAAAFTVIGGGDTASAAARAGITNRVTHVSTGGGASLELLSGAILPGVAALTEKR